jgi:hypothetical protein
MRAAANIAADRSCPIVHDVYQVYTKGYICKPTDVSPAKSGKSGIAKLPSKDLVKTEHQKSKCKGTVYFFNNCLLYLQNSFSCVASLIHQFAALNTS